MKHLFTLCLIILFVQTTRACTCFGADNFCSSLDTIWGGPDMIVLAEKLSDIHYGMQVKVIDPLAGGSNTGDTLTVWGDNGALCRVYTGAWSIGDTVLFALHETDFMGNVIQNQSYPPDLEQDGDHHISICGVYYLNYQNGILTGPIDGSQATLPYASISGLIDDCFLTTGSYEPTNPPFEVLQDLANELLTIGSIGQASSIELTDMNGRLLRVFRSSEHSISIATSDLPKGILIIRVINDRAVFSKKVLIQ